MANTVTDFIKAIVEDAKAKGEEISKKQNANTNIPTSTNTANVSVSTKVAVNSTPIVANIEQPDDEQPVTQPTKSEETQKESIDSWYSKIKKWFKDKADKLKLEKSEEPKTDEKPKTKKRKHAKHDNDRAASSYDLNDPEDARKFWNKTTNM